MKFIATILLALFAIPAFADTYVGVASSTNGKTFKATAGTSLWSIVGAEVAYSNNADKQDIYEGSLTATVPVFNKFTATGKIGLTDAKNGWLAGVGASYAITDNIAANVGLTRYKSGSNTNDSVDIGVSYKF